jgi:hypothetical protein
VTALYVMVAVGTLLSGIGAIGQLVTRFHLRKLRTEVNGQTQQLIEQSHALGLAEGVVHHAAAKGADALEGEQ